MSCYLRHMGKVLDKAGLAPGTKEERKLVDLAIRDAVGMTGHKCNEVWKVVKARLQEPGGEESLVSELKVRVKSST